MKTHLAIAVGFVASLCSTSAVAAPPTKAECLEANSSAQDLRRTGKLRAAKEKLALCVAATCPGPVREDCAQRIDELEKAMPTIVFEAKDGAGNDLTDVKVKVDGAPLADELDGSALAVDPGPHAFEFQASGFPAIEKRLVLRETEKSRHERLLFGASTKTHVETAQPTSGTSPVPAIIAFGAGGVGLIIGIAFTIKNVSDKSNGDSQCLTKTAPLTMPCDAWTDAQNVDVAGLVIGYVIAGVGAAVGTILLLTSSGPGKSSTALQIRPELGPTWVGIGGRF